MSNTATSESSEVAPRDSTEVAGDPGMILGVTTWMGRTHRVTRLESTQWNASPRNENATVRSRVLALQHSRSAKRTDGWRVSLRRPRDLTQGHACSTRRVGRFSSALVTQRRAWRPRMSSRSRYPQRSRARAGDRSTLDEFQTRRSGASERHVETWRGATCGRRSPDL